MTDSSTSRLHPSLFIYHFKIPFLSLRSFHRDTLWTFSFFGLSEREMDVSAYWIVKGHSSGDTLIQPHIHEYLGDGNEEVLHCCMRMEELPGGGGGRDCGQVGEVWRECVSSVSVWQQGVCLYVCDYLVKRQSCLITCFHSLAH